MQIYEDIPRLYTALAEWSACLTYLLLIRKTVRSAPFWLISVAFLILQSLWLLSTGNLPTVFWIPSMLFRSSSLLLPLYDHRSEAFSLLYRT